MKVRMKVYVTGTRDAAPWPQVGGEIVVPDDEGAQLCTAGMATPVAEPDPVETREVKPRRRATK